MNQLTQNQQATRFVAGLLLGLEPGDRLATIQEINGQIGVGAGTVQKAINALREGGAVSVTPHGHLGTSVEDLDYARLWNLAGRGPIKILLPFVDAPEFRGLSDGLDSLFSESGLHARIDLRRGASARMKSVEEGKHDVCVVSELAYQSADLDLLTGMAIAGANYYQPRSVALLSTGASRRDSLRIGYDPDSVDHYLLTKAEFPEDGNSNQWIPCRYSHLLSAILGGVVDCGIWHRVDIGLSFDLLPILARPVQRKETLSLLKRCENAYFVVRKDRADIRHLLEIIDGAAIGHAQAKARQLSAAERKALEKLLHDGTTKRTQRISA